MGSLLLAAWGWQMSALALFELKTSAFRGLAAAFAVGSAIALARLWTLREGSPAWARAARAMAVPAVVAAVIGLSLAQVGIQTIR